MYSSQRKIATLQGSGDETGGEIPKLNLQGRIQDFSKGGVDMKCGGGGGGGGGGALSASGPIRNGGRGVAVHLWPDTKSGKGLFSRRGGGTHYIKRKRGGGGVGVCNPQTPPPLPHPPPGSASDLDHSMSKNGQRDLLETV